MRVWELQGKGIESLRLVDRDDPAPGPGQVVVVVQAVSLNHRDLGFARRGVDQPLVPASDGAGEVVAVGPGVTRWAVGDRVVANFFQSWVDGPWHPSHGTSALGGAVDGMLAERVVLEEDALVAVPGDWSWADAATLPCAGVTAWNALFGGKPVRPGDLVAVQGSGGVSVFALQLAVAAGAQVAATSSSDDKLAQLAELGATVLVNYRTTPDWATAVREQAGRRADHVVEVTGQLAASIDLVAANGTVTVIGSTLATDGPKVEIEPREFFLKGATMRGVYVGSTAMLRDLTRAMVTADLRPVIDRTFAFDATPDAYREFDGAGHVGKVVITA